MTREYTSDGSRLDVLLSRDGEISRSRAAQLIREGCVTVNGKTEEKAACKPDAGAIVALAMPEVRPAKAEAQDIPLEILYQDQHLAPDAAFVAQRLLGKFLHDAFHNGRGPGMLLRREHKMAG